MIFNNSSGAPLPDLTNPATVADVSAGKEYIDGNGDKQTGTNTYAMPEKGVVFSEYDAEGYPTECEFVGEWTGVCPSFTYYGSDGNDVQKRIKSMTIPEGITEITTYGFYMCKLDELNLPSTLTTLRGQNTFFRCEIPTVVLPAACTNFISSSQFYGSTKLDTFVHLGQMPDIPNMCFGGVPVKNFDFSHCEIVPSLYSVASLGTGTGRTIKVPSSLLSEWQNATNWADLTDVLWQGV